FPYKYGGESLWGMDCSAFVRRVLGFFDIEVPRTSREQFTFGEKTSLDKLIPGDLVFFTRGNSRNRRISHVGIYIGDNKFIHASGADKQVVISELTSPFYKQRYKGACRIINFYFPLLSPSLVETVQ
ncbi:MAG: C40 family peptidase, partial [bacterium]